VFTHIASSSAAPPATIGDPGQFLDIDVDELARMVPFIALDSPRVSGPVTPIETTHPSLIEDALNRGGG
jgi:hypothetical protein